MFRTRPRQVSPPDAPQSDDAAQPDDAAESTSPSVLMIDDATFLDQTEGAYTIVDLWASWCGH